MYLKKIMLQSLELGLFSTCLAMPKPRFASVKYSLNVSFILVNVTFFCKFFYIFTFEKHVATQLATEMRDKTSQTKFQMMGTQGEEK